MGYRLSKLDLYATVIEGWNHKKLHCKGKVSGLQSGMMHFQAKVVCKRCEVDVVCRSRGKALHSIVSGIRVWHIGTRQW